MATITQGRVIPETDRERIAVGLRDFESRVGPPMLFLLSWMVECRRTGILWVHLQLKNGELARYSVEIKFTEECAPAPVKVPGDVECEILYFNQNCAGDILRTLSDAILRRENGWIHPHLKLSDGRLTWLQCATDFGKALDDRDGD